MSRKSVFTVGIGSKVAEATKSALPALMWRDMRRPQLILHGQAERTASKIGVEVRFE